MFRVFSGLGGQVGTLSIVLVSLASASVLALFFDTRALPAIGLLPLLPMTAVAGFAAPPLLSMLYGRGIGALKTVPFTLRGMAILIGTGAILAMPPIAIDLLTRFPRDINVAMPEAMYFYTAIALVAEVLFHLLPLAVLATLAPKRVPAIWVLLPVVFVEPAAQVVLGAGPVLQMTLVFVNVSLISAVQLWLFRRYGFAAMFGLRIAFYLFWHVIWGDIRLSLLF
jgi:hypothetical protein